MKSSINVFVISHSHWDREWYLPFRMFQNKLVILMDYLLDILETEPTFTKFVSDCQVAMVDDYLAAKPSATSSIKKALQSGKLLAGPYYVPPNEWLINGEGYVRNFLLARRILGELGLEEPNCTAGYSPDSACSGFGHPLQAPQIWRLFGLPLFVARGLGGQPGGGGFPSDFWWEAPDGSRLHVISLVAGYYSVADLSEDVEKGSGKLLEVARDLESRYLTRNVLLFNGTDHLLPQKHLGHLIAQANEKQGDFSFQQSSYEEYATSVESALKAAGKEILVYRGEFMERGSRESGGKMRKVNGYLSTRIYLKQANARCEQLLVGHSEPLATLAWIVGGHDYPSTHLWTAWKEVIANHHHDSIPGTSTDTVHRECMQRYMTAEQIGTGIAVKKLNELSQHVKGIPPGLVEDNDNDEAYIIAFNPHPWPYRGPITFNLIDNWRYCSEPSVRLVPLCYAMTFVAPPVFFITDMKGKKLAVVKEPIPNDTGYKFNTGVTNVNLSFVSDLPPFGYKVFLLHADDEPHVSEGSDLRVDQASNTIENQFLRVTILPDGRVTVVDKVNGHEYPELLEIIDYGDRGDQYDQAPVKDPANASGWSIVSSLESKPGIEWVEASSPRGRVDIHHVLKLPRRFAEQDRTDHATLDDFPVTVSLRLVEHTKRVDVMVTMDNHSENHRVEIRVPSGITTEQVQVDGAFCTTIRKAHYYMTAALHRFIDVNDGEHGIGILSKGIYEYNLARAPNDTMMVDLTLLRCVGVLAGHHIGNRWPANATPEAQCLGNTICELAIACHNGDAIAGGMHRIAGEFCAPPRAIESLEHLYLRGKCQKTLPESEHSFITMSPDQLEFSSFSMDEKEEMILLRFYNVSDAACDGQIRVDLHQPIKEVSLVDLRGKKLPDQQSLVHSGGEIKLKVLPSQIITLAIKIEKR
ncbi:MAG: glycoside hydrolase family 38 C-terminal domain-containing protein [Candidatus Hodarchaeota archaeon]